MKQKVDYSLEDTEQLTHMGQSLANDSAVSDVPLGVSEEEQAEALLGDEVGSSLHIIDK